MKTISDHAAWSAGLPYSLVSCEQFQWLGAHMQHHVSARGTCYTAKWAWPGILTSARQFGSSMHMPAYAGNAFTNDDQSPGDDGTRRRNATEIILSISLAVSTSWPGMTSICMHVALNHVNESCQNVHFATPTCVLGPTLADNISSASYTSAHQICHVCCTCAAKICGHACMHA